MSDSLTPLIRWCQANGLDSAGVWHLTPHVFPSGFRGVQYSGPAPVPAPELADDRLSDSGVRSPSTSLSASYAKTEKRVELLRVPHHLMLTAGVSLALCPPLGAAAKLLASMGQHLTETEVLALFVISHSRTLERADETSRTALLADSSPGNWTPYVAALPTSYDTTLFWHRTDLQRLRVSPLVSGTDAALLHEDCLPWRRSHAHVVGALARLRAALTRLVRDGNSSWRLPLSRDACLSLLRWPLLQHPPPTHEFLWALATVGTRSVHTPALEGDAQPPTEPTSRSGKGKGSSKEREHAKGLVGWSRLRKLAALGLGAAALGSASLLPPLPGADSAGLDHAACFSELSRFALSGLTVPPMSTDKAAVGDKTAGSAAHSAAAMPEPVIRPPHGLAPRPLLSTAHLLLLQQQQGQLVQDDDTEAEAAASALIAAWEAAPCSEGSAGAVGRVEAAAFAPTCALVPFFDLLNHDARAEVAVKWTPPLPDSGSVGSSKVGVLGPDYVITLEPTSLRPVPVPLSSPSSHVGPEATSAAETAAAEAAAAEAATAEAASEAFISYGSLSNLVLLQRYGFALSPSPVPGQQHQQQPQRYDSVSVSVRAVELLLSRLPVPALRTQCITGWDAQPPRTDAAAETTLLLPQALPQWQGAVLSAAAVAVGGQHSFPLGLGVRAGAEGRTGAGTVSGVPWDLRVYLAGRAATRGDILAFAASRGASVGAGASDAADEEALLSAITASPGLSASAPASASGAAPASAAGVGRVVGVRRLNSARPPVRPPSVEAQGVGPGQAPSSSPPARGLNPARPPVRPPARSPLPARAPAVTSSSAAEESVPAAAARAAAECLLRDEPLSQSHGRRTAALVRHIVATVRAELAKDSGHACECPFHDDGEPDARSGLVGVFNDARMALLDVCEATVQHL